MFIDYGRLSLWKIKNDIVVNKQYDNTKFPITLKVQKCIKFTYFMYILSLSHAAINNNDY